MARYLLGLSILSLFTACSDDGKSKDTATAKDSGTAAGCDEDGDNFCESAGDCNEGDPAIHPNAPEICDNVDNNCDDAIDEGVLNTFYADADGDGFGDTANTAEGCEAPPGYIDVSGDCDDGAPLVYPGAEEICDGTDNNCDGETDEGVGTIYYADADEDGYGDVDSARNVCEPLDGYVTDATDCNDSSARAFPGNQEVCDEIDNDCNGVTDDGMTTTYYADFDNDGFGSAMLTQEACSAPAGYVVDSTDCDDMAAAVNPDATEICDSIDNNCDGNTDENTAADALTWYIDLDGDGYGSNNGIFVSCAQPNGYVAVADDCDDGRALTNPGADEYCNTIDDDCDGDTDEETAVDAVTWYLDLDSDNYGNVAVSQISCIQPNGYVSDFTDCNDNSNLANPVQTEVCDSLDNDCDGRVDEPDALDAATWYADADADNYGDPNVSQNACTQPIGYVSRSTDCDDARALTYPGAPEYCNGIDDNCDSNIDENAALDADTWYQDSDADTYGDRRLTMDACAQPAGYVANDTDCDDTVSATNPGAIEYCNNADDDCDGQIDESTATDAVSWYLDADRDNYGNGAVSQVACDQPNGYVTDNTDCNDGASGAFPGATEYCDGLDNDCNGRTDESSAVDAATWYADADRDNYGNAASSRNACSQPAGYLTNSTDCDDNRALTNPGATEYCNGFDDDCDGSTDENTASDASVWYQDSDSDSYGNRNVTQRACSQPAGYVSDNTDCLDTRVLSNPGAVEYCNGFDDNCNGSIDESTSVDALTWYLDADRDSYGNPSVSINSCSQPGGYVANATDCNDATSSAYPGAVELCDTIDNDCDGTIDEDISANAGTWYRDTDSDGFGTSATSMTSCSQPVGYVANAADCLDSRAASYPGAPEYCNGYDDDCDGTVDEDAALDVRTWYQDADSDTYGNASVSDVDCDQPVGYVANSTDCLDTRAASNPGAGEYCNGYDDDCDGTVDESAALDASTWYQDADSDGYGRSSVSQRSCSQPVGYVSTSTDCADSDSSVYPGAMEYCDGVDDDCDGTIDDSPVDGTTWYLDSDADGTGNPTSTTSQCTMPSGYADNGYDCNDADATEPVVADAINGTSSGSGMMTSPFDSIQDAIDNAQQCVIVLAGTYREALDLAGRSIDIWGVVGADYTIIDANMPTCTTSNPTACGPAVTIASGTGAAPTLRGFTITGGSGQVSSSTTSTTCANSSASSTGLNTCTVTVYEYCGGGLYIDGDDPVISDVILRDNTLPDFAQTSVGSFTQYWLYSYGGGACVRDSAASFDGVDIYGNFADQGGGIHASDSATLSFEQGIVFDNAATDGAGVHVSGAQATFNNSAIYCNTADTDGGGLFTETSGSITLTNVGLVSNTSATGLTHGADAYVGSSTTLYMYNSIVENNISAYALYGSGARTFTYDNVYNTTGYGYGGTISAGTNSISSGSNFSSVTCDSNPDNDDFTLRSGSSSINTGNPAAVFNDTNGTRNDMGPQGGPEGGWN